MPVSPECVTAIPLLLQSLKVESAPAREESAGALLQLSLDKVCREEMGNGAFIQEVIHHFKYNASMVVRGRLSELLAALARTSSRRVSGSVKGCRQGNQGIHAYTDQHASDSGNEPDSVFIPLYLCSEKGVIDAT